MWTMHEEPVGGAGRNLEHPEWVVPSFILEHKNYGNAKVLTIFPVNADSLLLICGVDSPAFSLL